MEFRTGIVKLKQTLFYRIDSPTKTAFEKDHYPPLNQYCEVEIANLKIYSFKSFLAVRSKNDPDVAKSSLFVRKEFILNTFVGDVFIPANCHLTV